MEFQQMKTTVILVHGAWADGSNWGEVIPLLEKDGYDVIAVQNPLSSYAEDVANTRRVIEAQKNSVVVVGHSYGGAVITKAALGATNVRALVYVAAFGPDEGENLQVLLEQYPSKIGAAMAPDPGGYLYLDKTKFREAFAGDVSDRDLSIMSAAQKPINAQIFGQIYERPAWKEITSWYLLATADQAINPALQRMFAERMKATTREVKSSHVPFVSNPNVVADIITEAAEATAERATAVQV